MEIHPLGSLLANRLGTRESRALFRGVPRIPFPCLPAHEATEALLCLWSFGCRWAVDVDTQADIGRWSIFRHIGERATHNRRFGVRIYLVWLSHN